MVHNMVKLLNSVLDVVWTEDASCSLVTSIGFHDRFECTIPLRKYGGRHELLPEVVIGLLLFIASREWHVLGQLDKGVSFGTVIGYEATVVIGKA